MSLARLARLGQVPGLRGAALRRRDGGLGVGSAWFGVFGYSWFGLGPHVGMGQNLTTRNRTAGFSPLGFPFTRVPFWGMPGVCF